MNALLDALLALILVGAALFYGLPQLVDLSIQPAQNDAANQIAQMQAAGASYIKNHFAALCAAIPVGSASAITPTTLIADGDLPGSFNDFNVFGQNHILAIAQPSSCVLDGMVFTYGGDTIQDRVAIRVAQAGPANAMVVLSNDAANFEGAAGGQTVPISEFTAAGYAVTPGHLAAHIEPALYAAESPFLNRYYTGNSDDNMMHADLSMGGNDINGAKIINAAQQVNTPMVADPANPSYQLTMAGNSNINNLVANGSITATDFLHLSDARLKRDIRPIDDPVGLISRLTGHIFTWRRDGREDIGFIAQEVQKTLPLAVQTNDQGYLAVKYDVLAAPIAEAIKFQAEQIERQRSEIAELKLKFDQIHAERARMP